MSRVRIEAPGTTLPADMLASHPDVVWRYGNNRRSDQLRAEHAIPRAVDHMLRRARETRLSQLPLYAGKVMGRAVGAPTSHVRLCVPRLAGLQAIADELGRLEAAALQWRACVDQSSIFGRSLGPASTSSCSSTPQRSTRLSRRGHGVGP